MAIRVAVLSDSHVGQRISAYPEEFLKELENYDLIIHAGDHTDITSLHELRSRGEVRAVRGNMDEIEVSSRLPDKLVLELGGLRVGITHGSGPPAGLIDRVRGVFKKNPPDIIIFGHSHIPTDEVISGVRMLNPGAISGNLSTGEGSWAILTIDGAVVDWQLVKIHF